MESMPILTYAIMAITCIISYAAFNNPSLKSRLLFHPNTIKRQRQWDRFLGHGFIHSGWSHLIFNMVTMYFFGQNVELAFKVYFGQTMGAVHFLLLYFVGMAMASVYSYFKYQDNPGYAALGASGAVSAALFASIIIYPGSSLMIFPLPIPIPAIIFGPLYLAYSVYMGKKGRDNIGHDAHFFGAIFGIIYPLAVKPDLVLLFIEKVKNMIG